MRGKKAKAYRQIIRIVEKENPIPEPAYYSVKSSQHSNNTTVVLGPCRRKAEKIAKKYGLHTALEEVVKWSQA